MEALALGEIARGLVGVGPIIEIGTLFGRSTQVLALFKARERELITIDNYSWNPFGMPSELHKEITLNILNKSVSHLDVSVVDCDSKKFLTQYTGEAPALVFIDASHEYSDVSAEIAISKSLGAAVICGHDYDEIKCPGVVRAVKEHGGARHLYGRIWVL